MKIQAPNTSDMLDIVLTDIHCFDLKGHNICVIKERVLYCELRGLHSNIHYTKHIPKEVLNKTKLIKLIPVKIIGIANK